MPSLCVTDEPSVGFRSHGCPDALLRKGAPRERRVGIDQQDERRVRRKALGRGDVELAHGLDPEPARRALGSPFKPWQWAELWALVGVLVVQLWLYRVSVPAAAAWGLLVPVLVVHIYFWMKPLLREQRSPNGRDQKD